MTDMGRPHFSLLELLVKSGHRRWTVDVIAALRPELLPVLPGLMGTLVRHGLAVENNEAARALKNALRGFGRSGEQRAKQLRAGSRLTAAALQPHIPQVPNIVQTWSPTELGERVLGFYRLAADSAEDEPNLPV